MTKNLDEKLEDGWCGLKPFHAFTHDSPIHHRPENLVELAAVMAYETINPIVTAGTILGAWYVVKEILQYLQ